MSDSERLKICAIMSCPRLGWQDHFDCVQATLGKFGIPLNKGYGAFWGQHMQDLMEKAIKRGIDWLIALDYDTLMGPPHLDMMLKWMGNRPEADALVPLQPRRNADDVLAFAYGVPGSVTKAAFGDLTPIDAGHFGFTVIRLEAVARMPKPWFMHQPDVTGSWGGGRIDDDIWFWRRFRQSGGRIYLAPDVSVGHLELVATYIDDHGQKQYMAVPKFLKEHCGL